MKRFAFFPGCMIPVRYPAMEFAVRYTMPKLGIEIVDMPGASCCPDPIYFKAKDKLSWLSVAARNLVIAENMGLDIFTICSGCTATLQEASNLLKEEGYRKTVNARLAKIGMEYKGTVKVRHIVAMLRDEVGVEAIKASVVRPLTDLKVAIHYGCHLLKPSKIMQVDDPNNPNVMEEFMEAIGATPVRHKLWSLCCGKACEDEDMPDNMMRDLLSSVRDEEADLLGMICPTCFGQFDHGQHRVGKKFDEDFSTPPLYYFQLLAFAQGLPYDELGLKRQRFKPEKLKEFESQEASAQVD